MRKKSHTFSQYLPLFLFTAGLLLRLFLAFFNMGFANDTACFAAWSDRMFAYGPGKFYTSDMFTDYPPGFMYLLYIVGALKAFFRLESYCGAHLVLLKLPAILCDMACGYLVYREAPKTVNPLHAVILSAAYLFNPAVILNSSVWGQVDSVYTLAVVLLCLYLIKGKLLPAYIVFGAGVLLKPQMLVFTPVLLVGIMDYVFLKKFSINKLMYNLSQGLLVIVGMVVLCMPFGLEHVFSQYLSTLGSYPYAAVNAYNFWGFFGLNWVSQDNTFLFLSCKSWGTIVILLIVLFTFVLGLRMKENPHKYPILGAFIILTMFLFSVRMHERYMYAGLILLLFSYLYKPVKPLFFTYILFSLLHFGNTAHVLFFYDATSYDRKAPVIIAISAGMIFAVVSFYRNLFLYYCQNDTQPSSNAGKRSFTKVDFLLLAAITLLYSAFALYDLGNNYAPETTYDMVQGDSIHLTFHEGSTPATLSYYIAPQHNRNFTLQGKAADTDTWLNLGDMELKTVFTWKEISLTDYNLSANSIQELLITLTDSQASVLELTFKDVYGAVIQPANAAEYPALFDESSLCPSHSSYRDSMYFDEIYHGRTAYEFLKGLTTYETTHPPLGKIFIALGVAIFGMNPFGWRIIGTLFGIAMLPFLYLFGKRITGNTPVAALACLIYAFDFMHFTQTRIATIDVYITFFVIVMYYFMFQYCTMSFYEVPLKRTLLPLGACGIAMGLGFACKWTGAYAGVGLAILFFTTLYLRYREYCYAKKHPFEATNGISHGDILEKFEPYTKKTIGFCMLFFVAIPVLIYLLSYLPFREHYPTGLLERMINNQEYMLSYHSDLNATHPFSSSWQEWPVMTRPIWYYSNVISDASAGNLREGISAFGNPLVWWVGIPAFLYMVYLALKKKDRIAVFLIIGYLAQYLPWFFVTRITFIYHYFPSVAFVVFMIAHSLMQLKKHCSTKVFYLITGLYGASVFGLFLLFYPVLSGQPVQADFVINYLRWFDTWVLIAG